MRRPLSLSSAFALTLLLFAPLRPAAAASVVFQGKVTGTFFFTISYTPDGKITANQARDDQYTQAYANSILVLGDNQQGALGTVDARHNVTLVAPDFIAVPADDKNNSFILDGLAKDDKTFVSFHAYIERSATDPTKATALGHVLEMTADGTFNSTDFTLTVQVL
jgi:hypothetical protein